MNLLRRPLRRGGVSSRMGEGLPEYRSWCHPLRARVARRPLVGATGFEPSDLSAPAEAWGSRRASGLGPRRWPVLNQSSNPRNSAVNPGIPARRKRTRKPRVCRQLVVDSPPPRSSCHAEGRGFESLQPLRERACKLECFSSAQLVGASEFPRTGRGPARAAATPDLKLG